MNANRKSDESVVPATSANNGAAEAPAESAEERNSAKRNAEQSALHRTRGRTKCKSRGLHGVREAARKDGTLKFTALLHHVNEDCLTEAFFNLKKTAAVGVDGVTWQEYERDMEANIADLHDRIHRGAYRAKPYRRVWLAESGYPSPTVDSDRWASLRWRTRSSSRRCFGYCRASTSKTFSVSATVSGLVVGRTMHSMR